jgi:hypothetical protein
MQNQSTLHHETVLKFVLDGRVCFADGFFTAFASDLMIGLDPMPAKIILINPKTGGECEFTFRSARKVEHDVQSWHYRSTPESLRKINRAMPIDFTILND